MKQNSVVRALSHAALIAIATAAAIATAQPWELPATPGGFTPGQGGRQPLPTIDPSRARVAEMILPDLVITESTVARLPVHDRYRWNKVNFCVKNIGGGASSEGATVVFANAIVGDLGRPLPMRAPTETLSARVPGLEPGGTHCATLHIYTKESSTSATFFNATTNARLIVDRFARIAESNETNNEFNGFRVLER